MPAAPAHIEEVIDLIHEHWVKYVVPVIVYVLMVGISLLMFYVAGYWAYQYELLSGGTYLLALILLLLTHHWFFAMLLSKATEHIIVTTHRVIHVRSHLFFFEDMNEVAFDKMKTVEARKQGLIQNVLRYGELVFEKSFTIKRVPHPNRVTRDIEQAMGRT